MHDDPRLRPVPTTSEALWAALIPDNQNVKEHAADQRPAKSQLYRLSIYCQYIEIDGSDAL